MKVKVYRAKLVVGESEQRLTRSVARQFPVAPFHERFDQAALTDVPKAEALLKVLGSSFDRERSDTWLLLVPDGEAGLKWVHPVEESKYVAWHDDLSAIPTVVL